jgi:uncharacterized protein (TIGR02099 family)
LISNIKKFLYYFIWGFVLLLIILAIIVSSLRLFAPKINSHKAYAEALFTRLLNRDVTINHISASIEGFEPVIVLENVAIAGKSSPLTFKKVTVQFNILRSLWHHKVSIRGLTFSGSSITLNKIGSHWAVNGEVVSHAAKGVFLGEENIYAIESLRINDVEMNIRSNDFRGKLWVGEATLLSQEERRKFYIQGISRDSHKNSFIVSVDWQQKNNALSNVEGKGYVLLKGLPLSMVRHRVNGVSIKGGRITSQAWFTFQDIKLKAFQSTLSLDQLKLEEGGGALFSGDLKAGISWKRKANGSETLLIKSLKLQLPAGTRINNASADIQLTPLGYYVSVQNLEIKPLLTISQNIFPAKTWLISYLRKMDLTGKMLQGEFRWKKAFTLKTFGFSVELQGLKSKATGKFPEISGLNATLKGSGVQGAGVITLKNSLFNDSTFLEKPLYIKSGKAHISFNKKASTYRIEIQKGEIKARDTLIKHEGSVTIPMHQLSAARMKWLANFVIKSPTTALHYLPIKRYSPGFRSWLHSAFEKKGKISGTFSIKGPVARFPYYHSEGLFKVLAKVEGLTFHFHKDWPALHQVKGELVFSQNKMNVKINSAVFLKHPVGPLYITVPSLLNSDKKQIRISGRFSSRVTDFQRILLETPLRKKAKLFNHLFKANGNLNGEFLFLIPMVNTTIATLPLLTLTLNHINIAFEKVPFNINDLQGALFLSEHAIRADNISGQFEGKPLVFGVKTVSIKGKLDHISVSAKATLSIKALLRKYKFNSLFRDINGYIQVRALLRFFKEASHQAQQLTFYSDLVGLESRYPLPFSKNKAQQKMSVLAFNVGEKGVQASLAFGGNERVKVTQSKSKSNAYDVNLNLSFIDINKWLAFFRQHPENRAYNFLTKINEVHLKSTKLNFGGKLLKNVVATTVFSKAHTEVNVSSPAITGDFVLSPSHNKLSGDIESLQTRQLFSSFNAQSSEHLTGLPSLDLTIKSLNFRGLNLKDIVLKTKRVPRGVLLKQFRVSNKILTAKIMGKLIEGKNRSFTTLYGRAKSQRFSTLLRAFAMHDFMSIKQGEMIFEFRWPDSLSNFSLTRVNGVLQMNMKNGEIALNGKSAGALAFTKIINLLSLSSIMKRIQLDFSDLKTQGFPFEVLSGKFTLNKGLVATQNGLIEGATASIKFSGAINLLGKTVDLKLDVTPHITSSLPVIATIAGGPVAGIATFFLNKVVGHDVDRIVAKTYRVSGSWSHPKLTAFKE